MRHPLEQLSQCLQQLAQTPQDCRLWCRVGFLYLQIHEIEEALNTFKAAQHIAPQLGDAYYGESIAQLKLGESDLSLAAIRIAMRLSLGKLCTSNRHAA